MYKKWTVEVEVDIADPSKEKRMDIIAAQIATNFLSEVQLAKLDDQSQLKPKVAVIAADYYKGPREISLALAAHKEATKDQLLDLPAMEVDLDMLGDLDRNVERIEKPTKR